MTSTHGTHLVRVVSSFVILAAVVAQAALSQASESGKHVVLTFDDIPLGQGQPGTRCDRKALLEVSERITSALLEIKAPSAAFITTGNVCERLRAPALAEVIGTACRP